MDFPKQLEFEPVIENTEKLKPFDFAQGKSRKFAICGMGGSHLAADLIKVARPDLDLVVHSNYGLPAIGDLGERTIIVNSYSGNTEETLDSFNEASEKGLALAAVSIGGKLIEQAKAHEISFVQIPDTGIQPRMAVSFSVLALLKLMGEDKEIAEIRKIVGDFGTEEKSGKDLAKKLEGKVPIIYSPEKNSALALNWKVIFNETGKIPAFCNFFPELNHNEMTGFDFTLESKKLSQNLAFIFLRDPEDDPRIIKRMDMTQKLLEERNFEVFLGSNPRGDSGIRSRWHEIFSSILVAEWTAYYLALYYGAEPEKVPMVEEFKKLISQKH